MVVQLTRELINDIREMSQNNWNEFAAENQLTMPQQNQIIASLQIYGIELKPIRNQKQGQKGQDLLERYLDLQIDPQYIRAEVYDARRFMLTRQSRSIRDQRQNYGLVVGRIQSGKTAHMIGLALACIEKQNLLKNEQIRGKSQTSIVIILSKLIDDIRKQTLERLETKSLPAGRLESILIGPPVDNDFATNTTFKRKFIRYLEGNDENHETAILVVKKNHHVLNHLQTVFANIDNPNRKISGDVLIIDDECDYGTQDGNNADQDQSANETSTNINLRNLIHTIRTRFRTRCWYIGYTATPYCNVLMSPNGRSSGMWNLFPRGFIYSTRKHPNHLSNEYYFGSQAGREKTSPPGSVIFLEGYDPSLVHLVALHLLTRIIKATRLSGFHHTSMVNNAIQVQDHIDTLRQINEIISHLRTSLNDDTSVIINLLNNILIHYFSNHPELLEFQNIIESLTHSEFRSEINAIELIELNRRDAELDDEEVLDCEFPQEINYPEIAKGNMGKSYIVTGGARISRGLTLEGLTISLFTRHADEPNYDTMLQMSRWCGFRKDYDDLVQIMIHDWIGNDFQYINEVEFQIKAQIRRLNEHSDPSLSPLWIMDHERMNPSGKMPISEFIRRATVFVNGITKQVHWAQHPVDIVSGISNIAPFNRLFNTIEKHGKWSKREDDNWNGHHVAKNQDGRYVNQFLNSYKTSVETIDEKTNHDRDLINFIDTIIGSKYPKWNIAIGSPTSGKEYIIPGTEFAINQSIRTPNSRGYIQQIYSDYGKSTTSDLEDGESRTKPLLLIYLVDTSTKFADNSYCYMQRKRPSVQIGIILPPIYTGGRAIPAITNDGFEHNIQPEYYSEEE